MRNKKYIYGLLIVVIMMFLASSCAKASFIQEEMMNIDFAEEMIYAAINGDANTGHKMEELRNQKKELLGVKDSLTYDDLFLLAKIIEAEAGSSWIEKEHKQLVASVVINRMNSPEFPNSIYDVVYQKGQYASVNTKYFKNLLPSEESVRIASDIIQYGSIAPETVVFQAEFKQGSGTYKSFKHEKGSGTTYFCHSSYPELYK